MTQWLRDNAVWLIPTGLFAAAHLRTFLPPQAQGVAGFVLTLADKAFANYGGAKNVQQTDTQSVPSAGPKF